MGLFCKIFKKKSKARVGTVEDFKVATPEQKQASQFELHLKKLTELAKQRYGYDEARATRWAWEQIQKRMEKQRKKGHPIVCFVCKKFGANAETGPMIRVPTSEGKMDYKHQNC